MGKKLVDCSGGFGIVFVYEILGSNFNGGTFIYACK